MTSVKSELNSVMPESAVAETLLALSAAAQTYTTQGIQNAGEQGFCAPAELYALAQEYKNLSDADYEQRVIRPVLAKERLNAKNILQALNPEHQCILDAGALYAAEIKLLLPGQDTTHALTLGVIAQNRAHNKGVWSAKQHIQAAEIAQNFAQRRLPILTLIDTPGADAGEQANAQLQAHAISRLISTMMAVDVPTLGIILGCGYSGGAIPLAAANLLFATRGSVFSTIQPEGLANIARKQGLSWQQCAKIVGISAPELFADGYIDGVIDFDPCARTADYSQLSSAILSGLQHVLQQAQYFARHDGQYLQAYQQQFQQSLHHSVAQTGLSQLSGNITYPGAFGVIYRRLRYLTHIKHLHAGNTPDVNNVVPDLPVQAAKSAISAAIPNQITLHKWLKTQDALVYYTALDKAAGHYYKSCDALHNEHPRLLAMLLGNPAEQYQRAKKQLCLEVVMHLYNHWKLDAKNLFTQFIDYLKQTADKQPENPAAVLLPAQTLQALVADPALAAELCTASQNILLFDALYDGIIRELDLIAAEANLHHAIGQQSIAELLNAARQHVSGGHGQHPAFASQDAFETWLRELPRLQNIEVFLRQVESWKQLQHSRLSDALFALVTYLFASLIPEYFRAKTRGELYTGKIKPKFIGRKRDFWHRLSLACCDLQIQTLQREMNVRWPTWQGWLDFLALDFKPLLTDFISRDKCIFPGYSTSIHNAHARGEQASGLVVGMAHNRQGQNLGLVISNSRFQAGAIDMAAGLRMLALIETCREQNLPWVGIISSGGMQTKEGAGALFSMPVINEAISQYYLATGRRPLLIGFGDCTGGAQASFVTHPQVDTWYISGANIPFAGQVVVPGYLPSSVCLANYLLHNPGLNINSAALSPKTPIKGLVRHPFNAEFDDKLRRIDKYIGVAELDLHTLLNRYLGAAVPEIKTLETPAVIKRFTALQKILIHARACTAVKLIRDISAAGIPVVLVQSDPDMDSYAVQLLGEEDEVYCLGGSTPDESYLNANSVLRIAEISGVDALHPGIGFLSEDPEFAYRCEKQGLNFIGPAYQTIARMGDKAQALNAAIKANIPVVPGSHSILKDWADAQMHANRVGFPLILKAVFGGGGKGIAVIHSADSFEASFKRLALEAKSAFGRGDLYLEKFIASMRHVEVQILRDQFGCSKVLGIRDCSVQRNNQKLLEESASGLLKPGMCQQLQDAAAALADSVNYIGAGTVEFIFDLCEQKIYFMEMNTRLQVEHPVTEIVSGINIVQQQLRIAAGESIAALQPAENGYAIEARITAERVELVGQNIITSPSPGIIQQLYLPETADVQVISSVCEGSRVESFYDSLIIQVIAHGENRAAALATLEHYLADIRLTGITTNIPLLRAVLQDEVFQADTHNTAYLQSLAMRLPALASGAAPLAAESVQQIKVPGSAALKVFAPASGIFYSASSPQEAPFIALGDQVSVKDTLCLFEAMKIFRPFSLAELNHKDQVLYPETATFQVKHINISDGQCINAGDLLFVLEPVATL